MTFNSSKDNEINSRPLKQNPNDGEISNTLILILVLVDLCLLFAVGICFTVCFISK